MKSARVFLSLGSNLGDRLANLHLALSRMLPDIQVKQASSIYETDPWGYAEQPAFLNQVVLSGTQLPPANLLAKLKEIEAAMGRAPNFRYGPRLIDLDILFYNDLILDLPGLTVPHPQLHRRAFVLVPLAEIAPEFIHPGLDMTVREMLLMVDKQGVHPYITSIV